LLGKSRNPTDFSEMLQDAAQMLYKQPKQSHKIVEHIIENSENNVEIIKAQLIAARSFYVQGEYNNAVEIALEAKNLAESTNDFEMQLEINSFGIYILNLLNLDLAAAKYHEFTEAISSSFEPYANHPYLLAGTALLEASAFNEQEDFVKTLVSLEKAHTDLKKTNPEISKSLHIPEETEKALIRKLDQFENSTHFTKQEMSLASLASQFDTNTKYLSEIINTHKDKNFNSYINELRISYIIDKLKSNHTYLQYKISYLTEESGFSSHSSFATVFKSVTGISPTVFIDLLKTKNKSKVVESVYEHTE